jgi:hypothetical protein
VFPGEAKAIEVKLQGSLLVGYGKERTTCLTLRVAGWEVVDIVVTSSVGAQFGIRELGWGKKVDCARRCRARRNRRFDDEFALVDRLRFFVPLTARRSR